MRRVTLTEDQLEFIKSLVLDQQNLYNRGYAAGGLSDAGDRRAAFVASLAEVLLRDEVLSSRPEVPALIELVLDDVRRYVADNLDRPLTVEFIAGLLTRLYCSFAKRHDFTMNRETRLAVLSLLFRSELGGDR